MTARSLPPTAATFAAQIPYAFAKTHGVLPAGVEGDGGGGVAATRCQADGVIELKRVLQRPLVTREVAAEAFAGELARAYNQGAPMATSFGGELAAREPTSRA